MDQKYTLEISRERSRQEERKDSLQIFLSTSISSIIGCIQHMRDRHSLYGSLPYGSPFSPILAWAASMAVVFNKMK